MPLQSSDAPTPQDMVFIRGGPFRMGSDRHYPEEAPAHSVTVGEFWIDRTPVTNRQFKQFTRDTGHITFAEIAADPLSRLVVSSVLFGLIICDH
jgi:formylglycine-generating enzyme